MTKRLFDWLPLALGIVFLVSLAAMQKDRAIKGQNDFVAFYAGGKLAGTQGLYSRPANQAVIQSVLGFPLENVTYIRPPFYAVLLKPLSLLPYRFAYAAFSLAALASFLWFVVRFSKESPALPFFASMSIPLLTALCAGQDTPFLVAILGCSILLVRRERDVPAGLVLSLCAIKFHLFLFIPVLLLAKKRWHILSGMALGTVLLTGLGLLVAGIDSTRGFLNTLRDPWINASSTINPDIHGLAGTLHGGAWLEAVLIALVLVAFLWLQRRTDNFELLLAASVVCGLLVSFHSGIFDDILLLPVFAVVTKSSASAPLRATIALILTPIPYFMVLAGAPYSAILPLGLLVFLAIFCAQFMKAGAAIPARQQAPSLS